MSKIKPSLKMKFRVYELIADAVDTGIAFGLNRAFKHTDKPSREDIEKSLDNEIMLSLNNVIDFEKSE